ncbi:acetyltransferase [Acinetobacter qingfengensis]|uniref:Acetyltransferase n=1 Tax=Acinetobacter qingfengensis TaxID=1262585 RepID=A0A1E7RDH6_9GAMM|nr:acetyltransferase [Acinetobacter qingfengensis]
MEASVDQDPFKGAPSFSLKHRLLRALWAIVWKVFASWTPPPLHKWRVFLLNLFGAKVDKTAHVYGSVKIWYPPNLQMEEHSCLAPYVNCYNMAPIVLGKNTIVSQYSYLCAGTHDFSDPKFQLFTKPIFIHDQAWVAADAFVGPGVTIAEGAVVGARAVVFKNVDAWHVVAGNPAKFVKMRVMKNEQ